MIDEAAEPVRARRARPARPRPGSSERIKRAADLVDLNLDTRVRLFEEMTPYECAQLFRLC
jgi:hypothetical protein